MAGFGRNCGRLRYHRKRQTCLATGRVDVFKKSESKKGCFYKEGVTTGVLCCKRKSVKSSMFRKNKFMYQQEKYITV